MAKKLQWSTTYSVGVTLIDRQHQKLLSLLNESLGESRKARYLIDDLLAYVAYHFRCEETLMDKFSYPDYDAHCRLHLEILGQLASVDLQSKDEAERFGRLRHLLYHWLVDHIMQDNADRGLGLWLNNLGVH